MSADLSGRAFHADIQMQIVARDKQVILLFSRKAADGDGLAPAMTDNMLMTAEDALIASQLLADMAFEIDSNLRMPNAQKLALVEKHRAKLLPRMVMILNSQREAKTIGNDALALQVLDTFCSEVFS